MTSVVGPSVKVRTVDGWLDTSFGAETVVVDPDEGQEPVGWNTVFASRDIDGTITDWYVANTGHDPALSYQAFNGNLVITDSWLATNAGNGRVTYDGDVDRWTVERYQVFGIVRVNANNVTLRNMYVDGTNGILYGFQSQTNATGVIIEHSTVDGKFVSTSAALNFPAATEPDQIQIRYCRFTGVRAGIYCFGGVTAEYTYVHDLHYTDGSHNTGASIRSRNCTLRRNLIKDGNSAVINCYAENSPYTGILIQENTLRLPDLDVIGPEVGIGKQYSTPQPGETRRLIGNLFHRGGAGHGGGIGGDEFGWTEVSGNINMAGEPVVLPV